MRKIPVSRLQLGTGGGRPRNLTPFRVHLNKTGDLVAQRLNHCRPIGLVFDQLE